MALCIPDNCYMTGNSKETNFIVLTDSKINLTGSGKNEESSAYRSRQKTIAL